MQGRDFAYWVDLLARRRTIAAEAGGAVLGLIVLLTLLCPPTYRSTAKPNSGRMCVPRMLPTKAATSQHQPCRLGISRTRTHVSTPIRRSASPSGHAHPATGTPAITRASPLLPPGMPQPPTYNKVNPADAPIIYIALTSPIRMEATFG